MQRRTFGWRRALGVLAAGTLGAVVVAVALPEVASADITLPADPSWVTNVSQGASRDDGFKVKALAKLGNVVYVGGTFTQIAPDNNAFSPSSPATNASGIDQPYLFAVDATTGAAIASFQPKLNGSVEALEVGPPGSNTVYVGGTFTSVNGSLQNGLAVLDATTGAPRVSVKQPSMLNAGAAGTVWALRLVGSKLYVMGNFTDVGSCGTSDCTRGQAARFDAATMNVDSWKVYLQGGKAQAVAVDPSRPNVVYIGGQFTGAGSAPCNMACNPIYANLASFDATTGALFTAWAPIPSASNPLEVRDLEANNGVVYAAVGGGSGTFDVINGDTTKTQILKHFTTDGDVQTLAMTSSKDRVFVGGHFTKIANPAAPRCQMFAVSTSSPYNVLAQPDITNGGHYGPFAVIGDNPLDTWWGGQLTTLTAGDVPPGIGPTTCGTGDQKNKVGDASEVGGIAHVRDNPHYVDSVPPSAPGNVRIGPGIFNGVTLTWTPASDDKGVTAYYVRGTGPGLLAVDQVVATQWGNITSVSVPPSRLQANANYTFRVCAVDNGDHQTCSGNIATTTGAGAPKLPSPLRGYGQFNAIPSPVRILDTRIGLGHPGTGPITAGTPVPIQITGSPANVPTTAGSVVMNVTVVGPSAAGFITTYPNGQPKPNASNLNFSAGETVPNLVVARIGTGGVVNLYLSAGAAHVLADVVGWYGSSATTTAGSRMATVTPVRKLDTRIGLGMPGGHAGRIGPGQTLNVTVASGNVNGVVVNITGVSPTANTFVTAFPGDVATPPNASNLNLVRGQIRPNLVMVRVPTTGPNAGQIRLYNAFGTVDLLVDVVATYTQGSTGDSAAGRILSLDSPMRVVDTRLIGGPLVGPGSRVHDFTEIDQATTPNVTGLVLNATAVGATAPTFMTLFPAGDPLPNASNLNVVPGGATPNLAVARLNAQDDLSVWNQSGSVQYLLDVTALVLG